MPGRRDFLKLVGAGAAAASLIRMFPASAQRSAPVHLIWQGSARHRYVALTYDDCYLVKRLQELLELLSKFPDFKVTLFPVGVALLNNESKDPGIWRRFYDQGHEIGYHSWDHTNFGVMAEKDALQDYAKWLDALTQVMGFTPAVRFGRPTYGNLAPAFDTVCAEHRLVNHSGKVVHTRACTPGRAAVLILTARIIRSRHPPEHTGRPRTGHKLDLVCHRAGLIRRERNVTVLARVVRAWCKYGPVIRALRELG